MDIMVCMTEVANNDLTVGKQENDNPLTML